VDHADAIGPLVNARPRRPFALHVVGAAEAPRSCPHAAGGRCDGHAAPGPAIDSIDSRLLALLQADGRMPNARLAEAVGLSQAATHDRVRRLVREGYILGYEAVLNPALFASGMLVFAEVRVEGLGHGIADSFRAAVQVRSEILECHEVAGSFDYLVKIRVADMSAYRDLVASVIWTLPGVREVRTYAVMEEIKQTSRVPI
jgi:Lrp/AsnC family transcriptional regulator, leucine-responsive regulatory protein